jgi:hypothetical protein
MVYARARNIAASPSLTSSHMCDRSAIKLPQKTYLMSDLAVDRGAGSWQDMHIDEPHPALREHEGNDHHGNCSHHR